MFYGKVGPVSIPYQSHGFILWVMAIFVDIETDKKMLT